MLMLNPDSEEEIDAYVEDTPTEVPPVDDGPPKSSETSVTSYSEDDSWSFSKALHRARESVQTYFTSPLLSPHIFNLEDIFLSGLHYEFTDDNEQNELIAKCAVEHFRSKIWLTYRKNFPRIFDSLWTTDAGWGCMLRSMQMLLADSLVRHYLTPKWRYKTNRRRHHPNYGQILRSFCDFPDCSFSIHQMLEHGACFRKSVGTWFGPGECAYMIQQCVHSSLSSLKVVLANDGVLYSEDIDDIVKNQKSTNLLILVPVRLGLDFIPKVYFSSIFDCLQMPYCVGIAGGKPKRSLFFPGYQGDRLFYLDPHKCTSTVPLKHDFCGNSTQWHADVVHSIPITELDPSMCFGFFCQQKEWSTLRKKFTAMSKGKHPAFAFLQNRKHFEEVMFDDSDEIPES